MSKELLNSRYRTAIVDPRKKVKKAKGLRASNTIIIDEDDNWANKSSEDEAPLIMNNDRLETQFRKRDEVWSIIRDNQDRKSPSLSPEGRRRRQSPSLSPERLPASISPIKSPLKRNRSPSRSPSPNSDKAKGRMSNGTNAGLQSGKALKSQLEKERQAVSQSVPKPVESTVYRERGGKKVDLIAYNAKLKLEREKEEENEMLKSEFGSGLVQRRQREEAQEMLEDKGRELAVYDDDFQRNEDLKGKSRYGDTMGTASKKKGRKLYYQGPDGPANRYGILPGYRWDGVDRSSTFTLTVDGWELKIFRAKYQDVELRAKYNVWAREDM